MDVLITSTSTAGLSPLGTASSRSHLVLTDVLRDRLGDDHAALLADPVQTGFGDRFDWYATKPGTVSAFENLTPEDQDTLRQELARLTTEVTDLAQTLQDSGDPQDAQLGVSLTQALEIPSKTSIYAVRGSDGSLSPVLVNWGFVAGVEAQVRGVLTGMSHKKPAPAPIHVAAAAPVLPHASVSAGVLPWLLWLGWLLLAVMLAAILWLLIRSCALNPGHFAFFCPVDVPVVASTLEADRQVLEDEIAALERELALADRSCQPTEPVALPDPRPAALEEPQRDALDERLQDRGGQTGDLNFVLFWDTEDDLDLHVTCPQGTRIYYGRANACGGTLDVDANSRSRQSGPVENIFFLNPDPGTYEVRVNLYKNRTNGAKRFTLRVRQRNGTVQNFNGSVRSNQPNWRTTITVTE